MSSSHLFSIPSDKERIWEIPRNSDSQTVPSFRQEAKDHKGQCIRIPGLWGGEFLKVQVAGPHYRLSNPVGLGWGLEFCIFNKFPGGAHAAVQVTLLLYNIKAIAQKDKKVDSRCFTRLMNTSLSLSYLSLFSEFTFLTKQNPLRPSFSKLDLLRILLKTALDFLHPMDKGQHKGCNKGFPLGN